MCYLLYMPISNLILSCFLDFKNEWEVIMTLIHTVVNFISETFLLGLLIGSFVISLHLVSKVADWISKKPSDNYFVNTGYIFFIFLFTGLFFITTVNGIDTTFGTDLKSTPRFGFSTKNQLSEQGAE